MAAEGAGRGGRRGSGNGRADLGPVLQRGRRFDGRHTGSPSSGQSTRGSRLLGDFIDKMFGA